MRAFQLAPRSDEKFLASFARAKRATSVRTVTNRVENATSVIAPAGLGYVLSPISSSPDTMAPHPDMQDHSGRSWPTIGVRSEQISSGHLLLLLSQRHPSSETRFRQVIKFKLIHSLYFALDFRSLARISN